MKSKLYRTFLVLSILFNLIACESDVKDVTSDEGSSTFSINTSAHESIKTFSRDRSWKNLKDTSLVSLKVCIEDRVYFQKIVGDKFEISTDNTQMTLTSNIEGCLYWDEEISFDYTSDESFIELSGNVRGMGNFPGVQNFKFCINPWSEEVLDGNKTSCHNSVSLKNLSKLKSIDSNIEVRDYQVEIKNVEYLSDRTSLDIRFSAIPYLLRNNLYGIAQDDEKFTSGKFNVKYILLERIDNTYERVFVDEVRQSNDVGNDGRIESFLNFEVSSMTKNSQSQLELLVVFEPEGSALLKGKFIGITEIGNGQGIVSGSKFGEINDSFDLFYNKSKSLHEASFNKSLADSNEESAQGFVVDEVSAEKLGETSGNNADFSSTSRVKTAQININLINPLFKSGVNGEFQVQILNSATQNVVYSDQVQTQLKSESGLLKFEANIPYDETTPFGYQKYQIKMTGVDNVYSGIERSRNVCINPRLSNSRFLIDCEANGISLASLNKEIRAEVYLKNFEFEFIRNDEQFAYKLNNNLEFLTNRVVRLRFSPKLKKSQNVEGGSQLEMIQSGRYKVSLMVFSPKNPLIPFTNDLNLSNYEVLTGDTNDNVVVEGGEVSVEMNLPHLFEVKNYLTFKNIIALRVAPYNEESQIEGTVVYGTGVVLDNDKKVVVEDIFSTELVSHAKNSLKSANKLTIDKIVSSGKQLYKGLSDTTYSHKDFKFFTKELQKMTKDESILYANPVNQEFEERKVKYNIFESEEAFLKYGQFNTKWNNQLSQSDMVQLIRYGKMNRGLVNYICDLNFPSNRRNRGRSVVGDSGLNNQCKANADKYFSLRPFKFVNKILSQPSQLKKEEYKDTIFEQTTKLDRSSAYFMSGGNQFTNASGDRNSHYYGMSAHSMIDATFKKILSPVSLLINIGGDFGKRRDWFEMTQDSEIFSDQNRYISQDGQSFVKTEISALFKANFKACALLEPKVVEGNLPHYDYADINSFTKFFKSLYRKFTMNTQTFVTGPERFIFCLKDHLEEEIKETWYMIAFSSNNANIDVSLRKNAVVEVFRGRKSYEDYKALEKSDTATRFVVNPMATSTTVSRYQEFIKGRNNNAGSDRELYIHGFPGLIEDTNFQIEIIKKPAVQLNLESSQTQTNNRRGSRG